MVLQLDFNPTEAVTQFIALVDGHHGNVPKIIPLEIACNDRTNTTEPAVLMARHIGFYVDENPGCGS